MIHLRNWQRLGLPALVICILGFGILDATRQVQSKRDQFDGVFVACVSDAQLASSAKVDCATMFNANVSLARKDWQAVGKKAGLLFIAAYCCGWLIARTARKWQPGGSAHEAGARKANG